MPWRRRNEQGASSIDGKASARGEGSGATDQFCIVTLTLLHALVVATMPAYRPNLLVPARSWRTRPTLELFRQRPLIGWLQPFGRRGGVAAIGHYVELYILAVMHSARLCAGRGRSKAAGRVNAGAAGILGDHALHITFAFWRGVPRANSLVTR